IATTLDAPTPLSVADPQPPDSPPNCQQPPGSVHLATPVGDVHLRGAAPHPARRRRWDPPSSDERAGRRIHRATGRHEHATTPAHSSAAAVANAAGQPKGSATAPSPRAPTPVPA